jgi:Nuclease-related domain
VRNIGSEWRNLAEGLLRVEALETQFRAEWGPRLEEARKERNEAERRRAKELGRAALVAASVVALLLSAVVLALLLFFPLEVVVAFFFLALVVPITLALYGVWSLLRNPDSFPVTSNLSDRWWGTISGRTPSVRHSGPALPARGYGDEGEEAFVSYLARALSKEYVAVRGLLVARNLDADVIVVGPTGIWVYEVKHWSGEITCKRGEWRRVKTYRVPGGRLVQEHEVLRPFNNQWVKEANSVKEILRRGLPRYSNLHEAVGGGLVFTHGQFSFFADGSCEAWVGTPRSCVEALSVSSKRPDFTMHKRLQVIDALLEWSDRLHEQQGEAPLATSSAVELAERLHEDAVSRASSYLSDVSEPGSVAISKEVKETRK